MLTNRTTSPVIPDYEILRKIGGGAYGEVWMGRGVTGALRAVKVVWREDFEDERSFEREFEGVLKFEPLSRDHPGVVNLLHVGRSKGANAFYYYVMELGDDVQHGVKLNPVEYEGRTLRSDIKAAGGKAQAVRHCIDVGISLADALQYIHERGLSHRDVKPANVIFVNGKAKLADIGLVAVSGQRTFVGTEGFVPPEGPGSSQADVYSLGKVLYELATGKDRLQFPEVPDELHPDTSAKQWQELNQIICNICEPKISKRTIVTGAQLATALRAVRDGKKSFSATRLTPIVLGLWVLLIGLTVSSIYLAYHVVKERGNIVVHPIPTDPDLPIDSDKVDLTIPELNPEGDPDTESKKVCIVNFNVTPSTGVEVYSIENSFLGYLEELQLTGEYEVGSVIDFIFKKEGYDDYVVKVTVPDESNIHEIFVLKMDKPPVAGKVWGDSLEQTYQPKGKIHESSWVKSSTWKRYIESDLSAPRESVRDVEWKKSDGTSEEIILVTPSAAIAFADWLTKRAQIDGRLKESQEIIHITHRSEELPEGLATFRGEGLNPLRLRVHDIPFAELELSVKPEDSIIFLDDMFVGSADESSLRVRPGKRNLRIEKDGYSPYLKKIHFVAGKKITLSPIVLVKNGSLDPAKIWKNSLGMKFEPISTQLMVSIWETRNKDYEKYLKDKGKVIPKTEPDEEGRSPDANKENDQLNKPVVNVSVQDAIVFASWLTNRDLVAKLLPEGAYYALPTDAEWSLIVGLNEDPNLIIEAKALANEDIYPWVGKWLPVEDDKLKPIREGAEPIGNFSDEIRKKWQDLRRSYYSGYSDGYGGISPVGIYPANTYGIYDLAGNVSEWVTDTVNGERLQVVRGSNYQTYVHRHLRSSYRSYLPVGMVDSAVGFRLIIRLP